MALTPGRPFKVALDATIKGISAQAGWVTSGLAKDTSIQATNTQLNTGVPPAVSNTQSGEAILQPPGIFTIYTFTANGRIWAANVSFAMASNAAATNQAYARIKLSGGKTLCIVECATAASGAADSNTDSQTFPGLAVASGISVQLDVNNNVSIVNVVQRASGLVVVSVP